MSSVTLQKKTTTDPCIVGNLRKNALYVFKYKNVIIILSIKNDYINNAEIKFMLNLVFNSEPCMHNLKQKNPEVFRMRNSIWNTSK